jgi:dienelactone hydrolase
LLIAILAAGCGGDRTASSERRVTFRASDGVRLSGRLFGEGDVGVVLSHMGRPGDMQVDWFGFARLLSKHGYLVLTYDRRGVCPGGAGGCSAGNDEYAKTWKDIVAAYTYVRRRGAKRVVLGGASVGAMASIYAASCDEVRIVGLFEIGGINHASGYDFGRRQLAAIEGSKLFASSVRDPYGGAGAAREWYGWSKPPKELKLLPGGEHGTDMLRPRVPTARPLADLLLRFVEAAAPS